MLNFIAFLASLFYTYRSETIFVVLFDNVCNFASMANILSVVQLLQLLGYNNSSMNAATPQTSVAVDLPQLTTASQWHANWIDEYNCYSKDGLFGWHISVVV